MAGHSVPAIIVLRLHIFEHSSHMVFMEEPGELVSVLKEWIASLCLDV